MRSSFSRSLAIAVMVMMVPLLFVGIFVRLQMGKFLYEKTVEELKSSAVTVAELASAYYDESGLAGRSLLLNLSLMARLSDVDTVICDKTGKLLLCSDSLSGCIHQGMVLDSDYVNCVLEAGQQENGCVTDTGAVEGLFDDNRYIVSTVIHEQAGNNVVGLVLATKSVEETQMVTGRLTTVFFTVSLLVTVAGMCATWWILKRQNRPLREMVDAVTAFGHGELDARAEVSDRTSEEMQELALAFNNMAVAIQNNQDRQQQFVANVSHELKTPMTTIGGYVDGMLDGTIPPEKYKHYMTMVSEETKRLSRLVRSMLDVTKLGEKAEVNKVRFDMTECMERVLLTFEQAIERKHIEVRAQFPEQTVYTVANPDSITQVVYNLTDNAVKFCPEGGTLGMELKTAGGKLYATVSNTGPTIPTEELPLVFDRFHKLDKSRSGEGWGLGLYIVKTIICSHGEDISVSSADGVTEFTFTLPHSEV